MSQAWSRSEPTGETAREATPRPLGDGLAALGRHREEASDEAIQEALPMRRR